MPALLLRGLPWFTTSECRNLSLFNAATGASEARAYWTNVAFKLASFGGRKCQDLPSSPKARLGSGDL